MELARYDVVIYDTTTNLVDRIVACGLSYDGSSHGAVLTQSRWRERVPDRMDVAIVPAGSVSTGMYLSEAMQH
jgi:hypothetical protein